VFLIFRFLQSAGKRMNIEKRPGYIWTRAHRAELSGVSDIVSLGGTTEILSGGVDSFFYFNYLSITLYSPTSTEIDIPEARPELKRMEQ
jgi:hypothetical protein